MNQDLTHHRIGAGSRFLLMLGLAVQIGCAAHRTGDVVRNISFKVEGRTFPKSLWTPPSDGTLRNVMDQQASSWLSLLFPGATEPAWLDRSRLHKDEQRIQIWFAEHGYFDANFVRWEITRHGTGKRRIHPVSIRGYITPGEPSRIRKLTINGLDGVEKAVVRKARAATTVSKGSVFTTTDYTTSVAAIRAALLNGAYAFATVTGSVEAFPNEHAVDIDIEVTRGPKSRFGPVTITGVKGVPEKIVTDTVTFKEGDAFSPRSMAETRTAFFALRVFSVVNVTPQLTAPESAIVPVVIDVKETKWRRIKLGPGFAIETGKASLYGQAEWENSNLFGRLWHFDQTVKAGAAGVYAQDTTPSTFNMSQVTIAPIVDATSALTIPHVFNREWSLEVDGRVQLGIEQGYRFFSPELAPAFTWTKTPHLTLSFGYRIRYFDYFAFTIDIHDIIDSPLGLDLTDPYLLSMLEQHAIWDMRDDPVSPTKGWYTSLGVAEAGGPVLGNFNFIRTQGEARGYVSAPRIGHWNPHLVLAARLGSGIIAPYGSGPKAAVPYAERLYLGGGTTVRGWGANRLGPETTTTDNSTGITEIVPAGGLFDAMGNLELRKLLFAGITLAGFTDVGRVWPTLSDATFSGLQWSVGGGLRYATAIGPLRLDVGVRLGNDPAFALQPRWALHFGLSEAF